MSRVGGHYSWKQDSQTHPLARQKFSTVGSAQDIRERMEKGRTLAQVAMDTGLSEANLRSTLDQDAWEKRHPDGVQFSFKFRSWMHSILARLTERAVAAAKAAGLMAAPKMGRAYSVPREQVIQLLDDFNQDVPVVSLLTGLSEAQVSRIKRERRDGKE